MRIRLVVLAVAIGLAIGAGSARGQSISGTLTDAGTGLPLGNAPGEPRYGIAVSNTQGGVVASLAAGPDGTYQTIALFPGTYFVKGYDTGGSYVTELHSDISCVADDCVVTAGTPVVLSSSPVVVNLALTRAGRIAGTVRGTSGGTPLAGVYIYLYNAAGSPVRGITEAAVRTAVDTSARTSPACFLATPTRAEPSAIASLTRPRSRKACTRLPGRSWTISARPRASVAAISACRTRRRAQCHRSRLV